MSQRERRRDPYPWTWEPAAILISAVAVVLVTGLQLGRSLANGLAAGHWELAPLHTWLTSTPGVLSGDGQDGLGLDQAVVATTVVLYTSVGVVEVVLLAPTLALLRLGARRWSPGRPRGFASPAQVDHVLGLVRLRRSAHLVRPDLHPRPLGRTTLTHRKRTH